MSDNEITLYGKFDDLPLYWGEEFQDEFDNEPEAWFYVETPGTPGVYTKVKELDYALSISLGKIINSTQNGATAEDFVAATKPQRIINVVNIAEIRNRYQMGLMQAMLHCGWNRFIAV